MYLRPVRFVTEGIRLSPSPLYSPSSASPLHLIPPPPPTMSRPSRRRDPYTIPDSDEDMADIEDDDDDGPAQPVARRRASPGAGRAQKPADDESESDSSQPLASRRGLISRLNPAGINLSIQGFQKSLTDDLTVQLPSRQGRQAQQPGAQAQGQQPPLPTGTTPAPGNLSSASAQQRSSAAGSAFGPPQGTTAGSSKAPISTFANRFRLTTPAPGAASHAPASSSRKGKQPVFQTGLAPATGATLPANPGLASASLAAPASTRAGPTIAPSSARMVPAIASASGSSSVPAPNPRIGPIGPGGQLGSARQPDSDDEFDGVDVGALPGQDQIDHGKYAAFASQIETDGFLPIIKAAFEDERKTNSTYVKGIEFEWFRFCSDETLCSMDEEVVFQMGAGNIALENSNPKDPAFSTRLEKIKSRADNHPSIYNRLLVNKKTMRPLLVAQAEELAKHAVSYAYADPKTAATACSIDSVFYAKTHWTRAKSDAGERFFLQTKANKISPQRRNVLLTFARAIQRRTAEAIARGEKYAPLMQYIGYAMNASLRRKQHESFNSTNWLCMFVQAYAEAAWPGEFGMATFTVCLISENFVGPVAEMLLTRLTRAYYHAGGFSIDQAGESMASIKMDKLTQAQRDKIWQENQTYISKNTPLDANMDKEIERRACLQRLQEREAKAHLEALRAKKQTWLDQTATLADNVDKMEKAASGSDHTRWSNPGLYDNLVEGRKLLEVAKQIKDKHGLS